MSTHDAGAHPRAEADRIDSRAVALVGVGALLIFALAAGAAGAYLHRRAAERPAPPLPAELGQDKVGLVEQQLFDTSLRGGRDRAARLARLEGSGWVDRAHGVVHIPIERAMELVAQGARVPPSSPPAAPALGPEHGGPPVPAVAVPPQNPGRQP